MRLSGDPSSRFHRLHPIAGLEFNYDVRCDTCRHFSVATSRRITVTSCARHGRFDLPDQSPGALPGCTEHTG